MEISSVIKTRFPPDELCNLFSHLESSLTVKTWKPLILGIAAVGRVRRLHSLPSVHNLSYHQAWRNYRRHVSNGSQKWNTLSRRQGILGSVASSLHNYFVDPFWRLENDWREASALSRGG